MGELEKSSKSATVSEGFYKHASAILDAARNRAYAAVNSFPIRNALRTELSWTHYRRLSQIADPDARIWYMNECADSQWSTRQLERQINTMFRERLLASRDKETVACKIAVTAPAKEELSRELNLEYRALNEASLEDCNE